MLIWIFQILPDFFLVVNLASVKRASPDHRCYLGLLLVNSHGHLYGGNMAVSLAPAVKFPCRPTLFFYLIFILWWIRVLRWTFRDFHLFPERGWATGGGGRIAMWPFHIRSPMHFKIGKELTQVNISPANFCVAVQTAGLDSFHIYRLPARCTLHANYKLKLPYIMKWITYSIIIKKKQSIFLSEFVLTAKRRTLTIIFDGLINFVEYYSATGFRYLLLVYLLGSNHPI